MINTQSRLNIQYLKDESCVQIGHVLSTKQYKIPVNNKFYKLSTFGLKPEYFGDISKDKLTLIPLNGGVSLLVDPNNKTIKAASNAIMKYSNDKIDCKDIPLSLLDNCINELEKVVKLIDFVKSNERKVSVDSIINLTVYNEITNNLPHIIKLCLGNIDFQWYRDELQETEDVNESTLYNKDSHLDLFKVNVNPNNSNEVFVLLKYSNGTNIEYTLDVESETHFIALSKEDIRILLEQSNHNSNGILKFSLANGKTMYMSILGIVNIVVGDNDPYLFKVNKHGSVIFPMGEKPKLNDELVSEIAYSLVSSLNKPLPEQAQQLVELVDSNKILNSLFN